MKSGPADSKVALLPKLVLSMCSCLYPLVVGIVSQTLPFGSIRFLAFGLFCLAFSFLVFWGLGRDVSFLTKAIQSYSGKFMIAVCILVGAVVCVALCMLYAGFDTWIDFDLSLRNQVFWRFIHGNGFVTTLDLGINNLGIHTGYIYFLILPFYLIFPFPQTLLVIQAIMVVWGGYLLFRFCRREFSTEIALGVALAYLSSSMVMAAAFHGIHEVTIGVPILVLMYDTFFAKKIRQFIIFSFLMLMVQETMPFVVGGFAVLAIIRRRPWQWWVLPGGLAVMVFVINFGVVFPMLRAGLPSTFVGMQFLPQTFQSWLSMAPAKGRYLLTLVLLFLILGPFGVYSLPVLGQVAMNVVSTNPGHSGIERHYAIYVAVGFLVSFAVWADRTARSRMLLKVTKGTRQASLWLAIMLVISHAATAILWIGRLPLRKNPHQHQLRAMIAKIPPEASVMTNHGLLSQLSSRKELYSFYNTFEKFSACDYLMINGNHLPNWYPPEAMQKIRQLTEKPDQDSLFIPVHRSPPHLLMRRRVVTR